MRKKFFAPENSGGGGLVPPVPLSLRPYQGWMETVHSEMVEKLCS